MTQFLYLGLIFKKRLSGLQAPSNSIPGGLVFHDLGYLSLGGRVMKICILLMVKFPHSSLDLHYLVDT